MVGISSEQYDEILDILMPRKIPIGGDVKTVFTIRMIPSYKDGEFQYTFVQRNEHEVEITKRLVSERGVSNFVIDELLCSKKDEISSKYAASKVRNKLMNYKIPVAKYNELVDSFEKAVQEHNAGEAERLERKKGFITADGTGYYFWMDGEKKYDINVHGTSITWPPPARESPLITWVRRMRGEVGF